MLRKYSHYLIKDIEALEVLLRENRIESGITRIGAEQELCLLDEHYRPSPIADDLIAQIDDERINNELAKFNLEINLSPLKLTSGCFSEMRTELEQCLGAITKRLKPLKKEYILTGILPSIRPGDIGVSNMTPKKRYYALNDSILKMRGGPQNVRIQGIDELIAMNHSVMFESCNTSFQVHYQSNAIDFTDHYNWSQAIAAPVLAAACNSPIFLGKRLWMETRIALFRQAAETRSNNEDFRERSSRVSFGNDWCEGILEMYRDNLSKYRPVVLRDLDEDSHEIAKKGQIPSLRALTLYNSTIYQWNRACYGILNGVPHLRIENRYLPSGPSITDEIANAVFWVGLMNGIGNDQKDLPNTMDFDVLKLNFVNAAKLGLEAKLVWLDGKHYEPADLIRKQLLPIAEYGLTRAGVDSVDIENNLKVIDERVNASKTGAKWILESYNNLKKRMSSDQASLGTTKAMVDHQKKNQPVHNWSVTKNTGKILDKYQFQEVSEIMSRELITVKEEDLIDIAPNLMIWKKVRYLLVEDDQGELVGLVTLGRLGRHYSLNKKDDQEMPAIKSIMSTDLITVTPTTRILDALDLLDDNHIGCLPVLDKKKLVGILTEKDFLQISRLYLTQKSNHD